MLRNLFWTKEIDYDTYDVLEAISHAENIDPIIARQSYLLLSSCSFKDDKDQAFEEINPLQLAYFYHDYKSMEHILRHLSKEEACSQWKDLSGRPQFDFEPLRKAFNDFINYLAKGHEFERILFDIIINDSNHENTTLTEKISKFEAISAEYLPLLNITDQDFNCTKLEYLKYYRSPYRNDWNSIWHNEYFFDRLNQYYLDIGLEQRKLPLHVIKSFYYHNMPWEQIKRHHPDLYPFKENEGLGYCFTLNFCELDPRWRFLPNLMSLDHLRVEGNLFERPNHWGEADLQKISQWIDEQKSLFEDLKENVMKENPANRL